ncbi:hypothetical protein [Hyalangium gracile]|uniref:hypothetical protein n=1 Tax=Hyalangium gracile TaxID=394092 RepID=UPI00389900C4
MGLAIGLDRWFSPFFTLYVGAAVASALEHAHTAKEEKGNPLGIVHRAIDLSHLIGRKCSWAAGWIHARISSRSARHRRPRDQV